jgi:hypothetical protein
LIPEGNVFLDFDDAAELEMLSERGGMSLADGFWEVQRHFIITMSYPTLSKLLITYDETEDDRRKSYQVKKVMRSKS